MRRIVLLIIAGALCLSGLGALGGYYFTRPSVLKVAVARETEDFKLISALSHVLSATRKNIRLKVAPVDNAAVAAKALEAGNVDLAVVRSDIEAPPSGLALVTLHRNAVLLLGLPQRQIETVADLRSKRVGVVKGTQTGAGNLQALNAILAQYDISQAAVTEIDLQRSELFEAVKSGRVDAILAVGALTSDGTSDIVATVAQSGGGVTFIPVNEAKAIAQRMPVYESLEVVRGLFGGSPPRPATAFETLSVSVRLMARSGLKDGIVGDLLREIFAVRPLLVRIAPVASQIEAPATDRDAAIPVHPGAAAYFDDEETSFFDKYSDVIYIGAMLLSVIGSALAAMASRLKSNGHTELDRLLEQLLHILRSARVAQAADTLDLLEQETDDILIAGMANHAMRGVDSHGMAVLGLALEEARKAIAERRARLAKADSEALLTREADSRPSI